MRRTGKRTAWLACALLAGAAVAASQVEFTQDLDRSEVGVGDAFTLTVRASGAPSDASIQLPDSPDVESLSTSRGMQSSLQLGSGGISRRDTVTVNVRMRARHAGRIVLPPAQLRTANQTWKTQSVVLTVRPDHVPDPRGNRRPDPFGQLGFPDDDDPFGALGQADRPHSEGDLFLRGEVDKREVYPGEQVTLSFWIYSRVDLSRVDAVTMPKLDGFWSEDVESPSQLSGEPRTLDGIAYRAYLLKRLALFPVKPGVKEIGPLEADITTGFLFAGRREHRVGNGVSVRVRPLPPGAPPGFVPTNVGSYRLSTELSASSVELGQPVTMRVVLEGRGNLKDAVLPKAVAPAALKLYEPTTTDKVSVVRGRIQGKKVQEILVVGQQTGAFEIPPIGVSWFDPEARRYETSRTEPLSLRVTPGTGRAQVASPQDRFESEASAKNVLLPATGLRPLRVSPRFGEARALWRSGLFLPAVVAAPSLWLLVSVVGLFRTRRACADATGRSDKLARAARLRLGAATALAARGSSQAFHAEVERALLGFLDAKLQSSAQGLTREALKAKMTATGVEAALQGRFVRLLDACDTARFMPGDSTPAERRALIDDAAAAMEAWPP